MTRFCYPFKFFIKASTLLFFVSTFSYCSAQSNDSAAIKTFFLKLDKIELANYESNYTWRVIQSNLTAWDALGEQKSIIKGITNSKGEAILSITQRKKLYGFFKKFPNQIWLIYNSYPYQVKIKKVQKVYEILLDDSAMHSYSPREKEEKIETDTLDYKLLDAKIFTQTNFDTGSFNKMYKDWCKRFVQDIEAFNIAIKIDYEYGQKIFDADSLDALKQTFKQSIHNGIKGLSLRELLVKTYYAGRPTEGTEVTPSGKVFTDFLLSADAHPVGYGGTFADESNTVELWHMVFDDLTKWTVADFKENFAFKPFDPIQLPAYNVIKRNSWPALVFIKDKDGVLKLYGMSAEMNKILGTIYNAQIF
jgi:hypothetical protein